MNIPTHILPFWRRFVLARAAQTPMDDPTPRFYEGFHFDDNQPTPTRWPRWCWPAANRPRRAWCGRLKAPAWRCPRWAI